MASEVASRSERPCWRQFDSSDTEVSVSRLLGIVCVGGLVVLSAWYLQLPEDRVVGSETATDTVDVAALPNGTAGQEIEVLSPPRLTEASPDPYASITTSDPEDVPDIAVDASTIRGFLSLNEYDLVPLEVECEQDLRGDFRCEPVPGTLLSEHPYNSYPLESLFALPGDPVAQQILSLRLAREQPDVAFQHTIFAVGLSGGKPGPLVDFVQNSEWAYEEKNGEPMIPNLMRGYVVLEAARQLGHRQANPQSKLALLEGHLSPDELEGLGREVEALLFAIGEVPAASGFES